MIEALIAGYFVSISLIAAIGAQNAFVLRQGIRREHVGWVVLVCAGSDALLIAAGVAGFGLVSARLLCSYWPTALCGFARLGRVGLH
jgi:L-lysine exporter family protein LysE/ArgO